MKRTITALLFASALVANAGEPTYVQPAPVAPVAGTSPSLWHWFIGGTAGYAIDAEEGFYAGHIGAEKYAGEASHAFYLEVGFTKIGQSRRYGPLIVEPQDGPPAGSDDVYDYFNFKVDIIPVTLNYKYERPIAGWLNFYAGIGAGVAFTDADFMGDSKSDSTFFGQIFGGLVYPISERFDLFGGARWFYVNEVNGPHGVGLGSYDDVVIEGGGRFIF